MSEQGFFSGELRASRVHRARSLAALFAAGAVVSLVAIVLPGWPDAHRPGIAVTVVLAAGGALTLLALGDRVGRVACHGFLASGTALIAACQVLAGPEGAAAYAMLYVWIALHTASFFGSRAVAAHLAVTAVAQAAGLGWMGTDASLLPQLALTLGTQAAAALVVGSLAARLQRLADTDALTGVGNRRKLEAALRAACRSSGEVCLAVLDLDGFKDVNDRLGHAEGDRILALTARSWTDRLPRRSTLARIGGDEFMVVLPDTDLTAAHAVVQDLLGSTPDRVACSAGLAQWDGHESTDHLAARADRVLYQAKTGAGGVQAAA